MYLAFYIQLWIPSLLLVFNVGLGAPEKGRARLSGSLAGTICSSMKTFSETGEVAGLLKAPHQVSVAGGPKSDSICRVVRWKKACNNCPKFSVASCKNHEEISSGKAPKKGTRVVNGRDVYANEFPFLVRLVLNKTIHICGGSIYNSDWIITAAHCVTFITEAKKPEYSIIGGDHSNSIVEATEQLVNIKSVVVHEGNGPHLKDDIALVHVSPPLEFNSAVAPIPLLSNTNELKVGGQVRVCGWGALRTSPTINTVVLPDIPQTVQLRVISNAECQDAYSDGFHNFTETDICALSQLSSPAGTCAGDSGGPLFIEKEGGVRVLVGVVSGTRRSDCGALSSPSWYCRITYYHDWIVAHAM